MKKIRLGLIGCGVVGEGIVSLLAKNGNALSNRAGAKLVVTKIAVKDKNRKRSSGVDASIITDDPFEIVSAEDVDIVVEVMGGEEPALSLALKAAENKKHMVTANKYLLALHGDTIYEACEKSGVELGFEAAVAGAVPVIKAVTASFCASEISSIHGIVNGTANYILSRMASEGKPFDEILKDAQSLGYAEADPTFDIEGIDSAHKIAILASLAFETPVKFSDIYTEGITDISPEDIKMAREFGFNIKLLAIAKRAGDKIDVRIHPSMIPAQHPIANVNGPLNAVEIDGDFSGKNLLVGPGAGARPTASAVMGDVIEIARGMKSGAKRFPMGVPISSRVKTEIQPISEINSQYYLRITVEDTPGVLAKLSGALGDNGISIASMIQKGVSTPVSVVLMTHTANEKSLQDAIEKINSLDVVCAPTMVIRVERGEE